MKIQIENLRAQMRGVHLNTYQRALALDEYYKLLDYVEELEQLTIPAVVGRSEQLKAFNDWFQQNGQLYEWGIDESVIDDYLKSL